MSEPFIAEIKIVGFNFPPRGWAQCDGQILPINQNQALYALLGSTYGGDGRTTFALPDLRGRSPLHVGPGNSEGAMAGQETVALSVDQIPQHTHNLRATANAANSSDPGGDLYAVTGGGRRPVTPYAGGSNLTDMKPMGSGGANGGHANMQPYTTLNFVIALQGLFPPRN